MRKAIVAGQFYAEDAGRLREQISSSFTHMLGPGLPGTNRKKILGAIVPHAGYSYSGPCAAHSYRAIAETKGFDLFIIIGFNHSGLSTCSAGTTLSDWQTPLGDCKVDREFIKHLTAETDVKIDEYSHIYEHSIEVQLPFLQYIGIFSFVPINVTELCDFKKTGPEIASVIKKSNKKVCVLASSDFTHFGANYGYLPFRENIRENLEKLDKGAIAFIEKMDTDGFLKYIEQTKATICGKNAIALQMEILKSLGVKKSVLLKYYSSGEITGDYTNSVGYASLKY